MLRSEGIGHGSGREGHARYEYDAAGRLKDVIQTSEEKELRTFYGYDEVGNKRFQTDPNANSIEWQYDNLGRVAERALPFGMSENFVYDPK